MHEYELSICNANNAANIYLMTCVFMLPNFSLIA